MSHEYNTGSLRTAIVPVRARVITVRVPGHTGIYGFCFCCHTVVGFAPFFGHARDVHILEDITCEMYASTYLSTESCSNYVIAMWALQFPMVSTTCSRVIHSMPHVCLPMVLRKETMCFCLLAI